MAPAVADQLVAPAEVNCFVVPRSNVAVAGEMACAAIGSKVTFAVADPPGPVAVTVTALDAGMVAGALYKPDEEMLPAEADQLVAPTDVNCSACPSVTDAEVGEIACGVMLLNGTENPGPNRVPGFSTWNTPVVAAP